MTANPGLGRATILVDRRPAARGGDVELEGDALERHTNTEIGAQLAQLGLHAQSA